MTELEECKKNYEDLIREYRASKQMLKECEIEIEVARINNDANAFRCESFRRNDLQEELESLTPKIQRAVDAYEVAYRESRKKPEVDHSSFLSRIFGW